MKDIEDFNASEEEIIGCLWITIGFLSMGHVPEWVSALFFIKGISDISACFLVVLKQERIRRSKRNDT